MTLLTTASETCVKLKSRCTRAGLIRSLSKVCAKYLSLDVFSELPAKERERSFISFLLVRLIASKKLSRLSGSNLLKPMSRWSSCKRRTASKSRCWSTRCWPTRHRCLIGISIETKSGCGGTSWCCYRYWTASVPKSHSLKKKEKSLSFEFYPLAVVLFFISSKIAFVVSSLNSMRTKCISLSFEERPSASIIWANYSSWIWQFSM